MVYFRLSIQGIAVAVVLSSPIHAYADSPRTNSPQHIKINTISSKNTGIRIYKGRTPDKTMSAEKPDLAAPPLSSGKGTRIGMKASPEDIAIDASITCAMNRTTPMNSQHIKNLSAALKSYMQAENLDPHLIQTLQLAAEKTNTDFELLVVKAMLESDLGRHMKSPVSTARGVFQYIETTWLSLIQRYGAKIGYPQYAEAIEINAETGQPTLKKTSSITKSEILGLRFNPYSAAMIKGMQIQDESALMKEFKDSNSLSATDHYIAHMMGLSLAQEFYKLKNSDSSVRLAQSPNPLFREAVALNPYFFFDEQHRALTAGEAYTHFRNRIAKAYMRLRTIESQYGASSVAVADECGFEKSLPMVKEAAFEKRDMMPSKGLAMAALQNKLLNIAD